MEDQGSVFHAPTSANVTVMRKRPREYLIEAEIERLMTAAKDNRHGHRDATAILVAYRHALRSSELVSLRWDDVDFTTGRLHAAGPRVVRRPFIQSAARNDDFRRIKIDWCHSVRKAVAYMSDGFQHCKLGLRNDAKSFGESYPP
jgi:integrase